MEMLGCRTHPVPGAGCIDGCIIPACVKERDINFCAECAEFPCAKATHFLRGINETILSDWRDGNRRIREVGGAQYFAEKQFVSHYLSYKKASVER